MSPLLFLLALLNLPPCAVDVVPHVGQAPLTIRIRTTIQPDARNRAACLYYVSDDGEDSESCWTLEGDRAPVTTVRYREIDGGHYEVGLVVYRAGAPEVQAARESVTVVPR